MNNQSENPYIFPFLWMRGEDEFILRREIEKIYECGIRALCVEARPHDDFCGPLWWRDMDIVLDEAGKRNMKVWILDDKHFPTGYAAGLIETKYPERKKWYLADTTADIFGGRHARTLNVSRMLKPVIGYWQIGQPVDEEERKNNKLVVLVATRFETSEHQETDESFSSEQKFSEDVIDLTDKVAGDFASFTLPPGQWRVHAIYKTRTDGGNEHYINMMDETSARTQIEAVYEPHYRRYADKFGKTIAGFFSDEPELGNTKGLGDTDKLGKKGMQLPWSCELEQMLKKRWGSDYTTSLPFLFVSSVQSEKCPQIRYDFMDCVTGLYRKNFSDAIGNWCRGHGVEYIGHVVEDNGSHSRMGHGPGHWFRAMSGQDMAGIDVIGSQVIYGAPVETRKSMGGMELDGEFFHYILGKLGASSGHLDPLKKGRTMCELFGAYGWNFGVRDMRYLLDQLLVRGINRLVPHAFSMAQYPDPDCPPHFYAGGNNGQFMWFAELMKYAARMCSILSDGTHMASVAVLYDAEADWTGDHMPMQRVGKILMQNQIEFDVISADMLSDPGRYNVKVEGDMLTINNVSFGALLIPYSRFIPGAIAGFVKDHKDFPVIFIGGYPEKILRDQGTDGEASDRETSDSVMLKERCRCVSPGEIPALIAGMGLRKISVSPDFRMLSVYHYKKEGQIFMLMNESPDETFKGQISFPSSQPLYVYDAAADKYYSFDGKVILEPGQSLLLMERSQLEAENIPASELKLWEPFSEQIADCGSIDISNRWNVTLCRAKDYPKGFKESEMENLVPVSDSEPEFSGVMRYSRDFELDSDPVRAFFSAEHVYEVMRICVNGKEAGIRMVPPYQIEISDFLHKGKNNIVVEVANTPGRDQLNYPQPPFDFQHDPMEPSGMFGKVMIYIK